jgi:Secretion system C-terminal sorting domain
MDKKIKILLMFLIMVQCLFSQNMTIEWQQCFGGTEREETRNIMQFKGQYFVVGTTESSDGDVTFNHGSGDAWLIKTDNWGNMIWQKTYGGTMGDSFTRIFKDDNGDIFLLGGSNSSDGDLSNDPYPGTFDYWILKTDSTGQIIWNKILGGNMSEVLWTGTTTQDGGIVALGWSNSIDGEVSANYGLYDMWMIKLNTDGETEWDFAIGNNTMNWGHAILQTNDGGYLIGGDSFEGEGGNLNCNWHGAADAVLIKLDSLRNIEWQKCYGGSDHDGLKDIIKTTDGYIVLAYSRSYDGDVSGLHGEADIWVLKIDTIGNIIWQKCFGGSEIDFSYNLIKSNDGNFVIVGETHSNDGDVLGNHSLSEHDSDIWIIKINDEGDLLWQQCFGGLGNEDMYFGAMQNNEGNYVVAGRTNYGPSYDVQCTPHNDINGDWWVFEATDTTTGIRDTEINDQKITVYPNPAKDFVIFEMKEGYLFTEKNKAEICLRDVLGKEIVRIELKDRKTELDVRNIESGIYFYQIDSPQLRQSGKLIIP